MSNSGDEQGSRVDKAARDAGLSDQDIVKTDIEQARAELAQTVDALSYKLDVKARAGDKVDELKQHAGELAQRAKHVAPEPVQRALDTAARKAAPHRTKLLLGAAGAGVVLLVVRRRRHRSSS